MSDDNTIKLEYPITVPDVAGGIKVITELVFATRIKAKHLKALPSSFYEKKGESLSATEMIPLLAAICSQPESVIDELDMSDLTGAASKLQDFIGSSLPDGEK